MGFLPMGSLRQPVAPLDVRQCNPACPVATAAAPRLPRDACQLMGTPGFGAATLGKWPVESPAGTLANGRSGSVCAQAKPSSRLAAARRLLTTHPPVISGRARASTRACKLAVAQRRSSA